MISRELEFRAPTTVDGVLADLQELDDEATLLAGGMSLLPAMNLGLRRPSALVSLNHVDELSAVGWTEQGWRIGATVRHADLAARTDLGAAASVLGVAARQIGDRQVRNRGTIGGSLAQAESFADYLPVLLALGARVDLVSPRGARTVAIADFVRGPNCTALAPHEAIAAVAVPEQSGTAAYGRLARTEGSAPLVTAAAVAGDDAIVVAVGGATEVPLRVALPERSPEHAQEAVAARLVEVAADPRLADEDLRYRRAMAAVFARRAVAAALAGREAVS